jgi:hypothetical protein
LRYSAERGGATALARANIDRVMVTPSATSVPGRCGNVLFNQSIVGVDPPVAEFLHCKMIISVILLVAFFCFDGLK